MKLLPAGGFPSAALRRISSAALRGAPSPFSTPIDSALAVAQRIDRVGDCQSGFLRSLENSVMVGLFLLWEIF